MIRLLLASLFILPLAAFADATVSNLGWLEGSWKSISQTETYESSFSSAAGNLVIGTTKLTSPDGKLSFYEFDEIKINKGNVELTPYVSGAKGVTFTATEISDNKVVFENPTHPFPNRITYSLNEKGQLVTVVEGNQNVRLEFVLNKR